MTVPFTWYGTYEVLLRKEGYETIRTGRRAEAPVYQWLGIDLLFETIVPGQRVDEHHWEFELSLQEPTDPNALIDRAMRLRQENAAIEDGA